MASSILVPQPKGLSHGRHSPLLPSQIRILYRLRDPRLQAQPQAQNSRASPSLHRHNCRCSLSRLPNFPFLLHHLPPPGNHRLPASQRSLFTISISPADLAPLTNRVEQWAAFNRIKNAKIYSARNHLTHLFSETFLETLAHINNALDKIPALQKHLNRPVPDSDLGHRKKNIITAVAQDIIHGRVKISVLQDALMLGADPSNVHHNEFFPGAAEPLKVILLQYVQGFTNPLNDSQIKNRFEQVVHTLMRHGAACHVSCAQKDAIFAQALPS